MASLDAPTVAIVWCMAFAWAAHVSLPGWVLALIPLGVWAAYIADRLLDARSTCSMNVDHLRDRHLFHWRHRRIFIPLAVASMLVAAGIICIWMPRSIREHDSLLAAASVMYFARVHSTRTDFALFSKEFLVGVLFTLGCALPAWSRVQFSAVAHFWPLAIATAIFGSLAWLNCVAIDRWESGDRFARGRSIGRFAALLACASSVCVSLLAHTSARVPALVACAALAALLLSLLDCYRNRLTPVTLRTAADAVLLTPLIPLVLGALLRR